MNTATGTATYAHMAKLEGETVQNHYHYFIQKWAPNDSYDGKAEFYSDLMMLIRAVHQDAARPAMAQLEKLVAALPLIVELKK